MDDLRQKFELTETYIVPGKKRRAPKNTADILINTRFSKQDYENSKKEEDLRKILIDLRKELQDKEIDLERELQKYNRDGLIREVEFREIFSNYRLQFTPEDIDIIVDKYINTFDKNIDSFAMIDEMHNLEASFKQTSPFHSPRVSIRQDIKYKVARK